MQSTWALIGSLLGMAQAQRATLEREPQIKPWGLRAGARVARRHRQLARLARDRLASLSAVPS